jgi:integrase
LADRRKRGSKGVADDELQANARIIPALGALKAETLTKRQIDAWLLDLANAPRRIRTRKFASSQATRDFDRDDSEEVRRRRSTANRVLTILKAALNHAFNEGHIGSDDAWRTVKPFREADAAVVHFLSAGECRRLVNGCQGAFRNLVKGALLTGCRYGELTRMKIADFNPEAGTITVRESKAGKPGMWRSLTRAEIYLADSPPASYRVNRFSLAKMAALGASRIRSGRSRKRAPAPRLIRPRRSTFFAIPMPAPWRAAASPWASSQRSSVTPTRG